MAEFLIKAYDVLHDDPALNNAAYKRGGNTSQAYKNATAATITATGALSVYGFGIVGGGSAATTKGDAAGGGTLLSSGLFAGVKTLAAGETLDLTYTLSGSSS